MSQKRREKGMGNIYQRGPNSWTGRLTEGLKPDGKPNTIYFSGKTEDEVKLKILEHVRAGIKIETYHITVEEYFRDWLVVFKQGTIKRSSYDALEKTLENYIIPNVGKKKLVKLTSKDIQGLLTNLKNRGYSYSTVKKVYDCFGEVLRHACIEKAIASNPMLLVKMLHQDNFEKKEPRFFTREECALIIEESSREYSTGNPVYIYGDVYVLMLNTGLRIGEAIGLEKADWDEVNNILHVHRNVQSVSKRDREGKRVKGRELVTNSTKTYSGDRIIPLNKYAQEALQRLCSRYPESKYIVCSSNGTQIPPERLERTFCRVLKNVGIDHAGPHSLRHTFASILFANGTDVKTVSKLMGHASIQITLNTYVHLIDKPDHKAVALSDDAF